MAKSRLLTVLAVTALILCLAHSALAQMPQPFSADMSTTSNSSVQMKGQFHFSAPNIRMDMTDTGAQRRGGPGGGKMSMIVDGAKKTSYTLMHDQQMYMELSANSVSPMRQHTPRLEDYRSDPCSSHEFATCKKVGTETVNGRTCDKWEAVEKNGDKFTFWIDQKLHFPIKSQTKDTTTEFTNIKEGPQDSALFVVPASYKKFDPGAFGRGQ
jgi:Domain of unknown function (DUF4412)